MEKKNLQMVKAKSTEEKEVNAKNGSRFLPGQIPYRSETDLLPDRFIFFTVRLRHVVFRSFLGLLSLIIFSFLTVEQLSSVYDYSVHQRFGNQGAPAAKARP